MSTHIILNKADAISEFSQGSNDGCGPYNEELLYSQHYGIYPSPIHAEQSRRRMIANGSLTPGRGMTVQKLYDDLTGVNGFHMAATLENSGINTAYALMHQAITRLQPSILNLSQAHNLPHNEQGVYNHFITIMGIDDTLGYLVANTDQLDDAGHVRTSLFVPLYWCTWAQIAAAAPFACIALGTGY